MRHQRAGKKLGRDSSHRRALCANLACSLIGYGRIRTLEAKAKAVKPFAEQMITLGKRGDLAARRQAISELRSKDIVHTLFADVAPRFADRPGGYTRIVKLGPRQGDAADMVYLELVDYRPEAVPGAGGSGDPVLGVSAVVVAGAVGDRPHRDPPRSSSCRRRGDSSRSPLRRRLKVAEAWLFIAWSHRRRPAVGQETLIGAVGQAVTNLLPDGQVRVSGELWSARCDGVARAGDDVLVKEVDGLTLVVRRRYRPASEEDEERVGQVARLTSTHTSASSPTSSRRRPPRSFAASSVRAPIVE